MITVTAKDKSILTPLKKPVAVPTSALAEAITQEAGRNHKPLTHLASIAIDLVIPARAQVMEDILAYIDTDVVCYRAENNPALTIREQTLLDPVVLWANEHFGFALTITSGVMPVRQSEQVVSQFIEALDEYTPWQLAALAVATKLCGSLIIASALVEGKIAVEEAFDCSFIEDIFETELWGEDDEKEARHAQLKRELMAVKAFLELLQ